MLASSESEAVVVFLKKFEDLHAKIQAFNRENTASERISEVSFMELIQGRLKKEFLRDPLPFLLPKLQDFFTKERVFLELLID
jgi:hypothetical protein